MGLIWIFIAVGGFIGSYIPVLFGVSEFSAWSILGGVIGSLAGIWAFKKIGL
jgi:hypothetical protein